MLNIKTKPSADSRHSELGLNLITGARKIAERRDSCESLARHRQMARSWIKEARHGPFGMSRGGLLRGKRATTNSRAEG